ncbi:MAG TPA: hypothetical protein VHZ51_00340 [Ktedonobacteraceae bacterium]|jgi:hypothetical protein|nr:hypothetical protein [Ktedonobacteraceae bacterium]
MQQVVPQRESAERMSWARALIFGVGFFFIAMILIGQFPGFIFFKMTEANLAEFQRACAALAVVGLGGFAIVQVIVLLFDPKPLIPPGIFTGLGAILTAVGLALALWATGTGCVPAAAGQSVTCNQYFPYASTHLWPVLGGKFLWFQIGAVDLSMVGIGILTVGLAMIFYSVLAIREQRNPDRRDLGTTPAIRGMIIVGTLLLLLFLAFYTLVNDQGLALILFPKRPFVGQKLVDLVEAIVLGAAIFVTLAAFALRFHYLMRPVRKKTMSGLYMVGAIGLAQTGAISLLAWIVTYPLLAWMHNWSFIGLNTYLTVCGLQSNIPGSCTFSQQAGYIIDAIITSNFLLFLILGVVFAKSHRNLVVIASVVTVAIIGGTTLMLHTDPSQILVAMALTVAMLILAGIWTSVARRDFARVGENNLGCMGQWLVIGTCLFIYIAAFGFFSLPIFSNDTEANILFTSGTVIQAPAPVGQPITTLPSSDAIITMVIMGILALIQFYFLIRNRYKA